MDILLQHITGTSYSLPCLTYTRDNKLAMSDSKRRLILVDFDRLTNYSDPTIIGLTHYTLVSTCLDITQISTSNKQTSGLSLSQRSLLPEFHTITNSIRDTILNNTNSIIKKMTFLVNQEHLKLKESVLLVLDTSGRLTIIKEDNKHITQHPALNYNIIDLRSTLAIKFIEETVVTWYKILGTNTIGMDGEIEHILNFKLVVLNRVNCIILIDVVFNMETLATNSKEIFRGCIQNKFIIMDSVERGGEVVFVLFCHETKTLMFYAERGGGFVGLGNINIKQYMTDDPILFNSIHVLHIDEHNNKITILLRGDAYVGVVKGVVINRDDGNIISIEDFEFIDVCVIGEVVHIDSYTCNTNNMLVIYYINHKLDIVLINGNDTNTNTNILQRTNDLTKIEEGIKRVKTKIESTFDVWEVKRVEIDLDKECIYSVVSAGRELFVLMSSMGGSKKEDGRFFNGTYLENEVVIKKGLSKEMGKKMCMNCLEVLDECNGDYNIMKEKCVVCKVGELYSI
eukprot:GAHX01000140.1.p1 GENE.GAHX01000140.1~~GAHX01000140.1.p1  ORF type:complete len:512 (-),score=95.42 GAHX01000140.1:729-2264(-)